MRFPLMAILFCVVIVGCAKKDEFTASAPAKPGKEAADSPSRFMAYEHSIELDIEEQRVAAVHKSIEDACRKAVAEQCVVLESRLNTGRYVSAALKVRAKPEGIRQLVSTLSTEGEVIRQSVKAEDLASPIGDAAKQLEMLNDYRSKLEGLRGKASSDIDALIKVNKELAQVQSEIEAMSGERAHLLLRVETEILNVSLSSVNGGSFWRPIANAASDFGTNLSQGASSTITGVAFLLPWGLTLFFFWWAVRKLWLRRKKPRANA